MKLKVFIFTSILFVYVISFPVITKAADVNWTSESYEATASVESVSQTSYGPPLPVSATATYFNNSATSSITGTSMYVDMWAELVFASASTSFTGTFQADQPYFVYSYDWGAGRNSSRINFPTHYLNVFDITDNASLFDQTYYDSVASGNVYVPTLSGHEIEVEFGINSYAMLPIDASNTTGMLYYSTATSVVPEPISSILFIAGGTLLAGRRYIKRKNIA